MHMAPPSQVTNKQTNHNKTIIIIIITEWQKCPENPLVQARERAAQLALKLQQESGGGAGAGAGAGAGSD